MSAEIETCVVCGRALARALMVPKLRNGERVYSCRSHEMRRVHGGRLVPKAHRRAS